MCCAAPGGLEGPALRGAAGHIEAVQDPLGLAGLAGIVLLHAGASDEMASDEGGQQEAEPAQDGGSTVTGAPAGNPLDDRRPALAAGLAAVADGRSITGDERRGGGFWGGGGCGWRVRVC